MTQEQLREQVEFELNALRQIVDEIDDLVRDVGDQDPGIRVSTLVGAFMQQFYNGIESVLNRFCKYHSVPLPEGDRFHADLLAMFGPEHVEPLPLLLDDNLFAALDPFRQFRHVFRTSYGFQLDWSRFSPGAATAREVLIRFEAAVQDAL